MYGRLISNKNGLHHLDLSRFQIEQTRIKILFHLLISQNSLKNLDNHISMHPIKNCVFEYLKMSKCNLCEGEINLVCGAFPFTICDRICKKGLPQTSSLSSLMIHNFTLKTTIAMKFGQ